jgi:hypothetical protein
MTYTVKFWRLLTSGFLIIIPFLGAFLFACYLIITISTTDLSGEKTFIIFLMLPFCLLTAYFLNRYFRCAKQVLEISDDGKTFYFGDNINRNKYNKDDILKITIYQPGGGGIGDRRLHDFYVYEILFKDGTVIKFSNSLISESEVLDNFPSDLIRYGVDKYSFWKL